MERNRGDVVAVVLLLMVIVAAILASLMEAIPWIFGIIGFVIGLAVILSIGSRREDRDTEDGAG